METVLGVVRYLFVGTVFVGGGVVFLAIVLLAIQKNRPDSSGKSE